MNAGLEHFFKNFSIFFKKTLKFPKSLPLPFLDVQETVHQVAVKKSRKFLKIFSKNPKVSKRAAVTGLDVAKKSRFIALFFRSKQRFFGTFNPLETRAARAWMSDLRVFVRQTPTGRVRYFPT